MSALTVLTNAFRHVGLEVDAPAVTATDWQTEQMLRFINEAGLDVARRARWQKMMTTDTVTGPTSSHTLPADYYALDSVYLTKATWQPVRILTEPHEWAFVLIRTTAQPYCHVEGGSLLFSPQVDSDGAVMRYVSSQWVSGKDEATADGDTILVPERLVELGAAWRWKRQQGLPYDDIMAEAEASLAADIRADRGMQ